MPDDKILEWFKLKAFADNKINVTEKLKFVLVNSIFSFSHNVFNGFLYRVVKSYACVVKS